MIETAKEYLKRRSQVTENRCKVWIGCVQNSGYGHLGPMKLSKLYKVNTAHQLAYIVYKGDYDRSLDICHTCHNRLCINPEHLYAGTRKQNMKDMYQAGRDNHAMGLDNGRAKLSDEQILEIKRLLKYKHPSDIAKIYNISISYIYNIKANRRRSTIQLDK